MRQADRIEQRAEKPDRARIEKAAFEQPQQRERRRGLVAVDAGRKVNAGTRTGVRLVSAKRGKRSILPKFSTRKPAAGAAASNCAATARGSKADEFLTEGTECTVMALCWSEFILSILFILSSPIPCPKSAFVSP
ncbi:MAG: hypothetical protein ABSE59_11565, partial [Opitutaceae bacterium]